MKTFVTRALAVLLSLSSAVWVVLSVFAVVVNTGFTRWPWVLLSVSSLVALGTGLHAVVRRPHRAALSVQLLLSVVTWAIFGALVFKHSDIDGDLGHWGLVFFIYVAGGAALVAAVCTVSLLTLTLSSGRRGERS